MNRPRFFIPPSQIHGSTVTLDDPRQIHHLRDVLRLGLGDQIMAFDGQGSQWLGTIARAGARRVVIRLDQHRDAPVERAVSIWLGQALLKADRFEWIVQKATELGVATLSPLVTRHTVVRLSSEQAISRRQRWQRIATEAAKQCQRATIPVIHPPQSLEALLRRTQRSSLILIPTLSVTTIPLQDVLPGRQAAQEVVALIGPEGDFSPEEVALAEKFGARPVSLGPRTLRAETAAIALLAILQHVLGS
ncbi:MAG: 16S rRNA (uracil(1498)-N(3))-methyltransferase [Candidatus Omnitrophica bacterium]|nr:16S rRNA (uracil(1498)-N(3))-methyltransferase [Candidatus Omnitrophota bacterium]